MRNILFIALAILGIAVGNAALNRVEIGATATATTFSKANTIYVISGDVKLSGTVSIGANSILQFDGGTLSGATLVGNNTEIVAPHYPILRGCRLDGTFTNAEMSAHWFGAKGDGTSDDAPAINNALANAGTATVTLDNRRYLVKQPININRKGQRLRCAGTIATKSGCTALQIMAHSAKIDINRMENLSNKGKKPQEFTGTAILFTGNTYHVDLDVGTIEFFERGLSFVPEGIDGYGYAGSQYCKINFQIINSKYCIYIDVFKHGTDTFNTWFNENQFFGGRLIGYYGIYSTKPSRSNTGKVDVLNGNVFYSIGFEDIYYPICLNHCWLCSFHDLRMSESLHSDTYIDLDDCMSLDIDVKSMIPYKRVKATNCRDVKISRCFTDDGYGVANRNRVLYLDSQNGVDMKFIASDLAPRNYIKEVYYGRNTAAGARIGFNDLMISTYDGQQKLSDFCHIILDSGYLLTVDFSNSIKTIAPDMTLKISLYDGASVNFVDGTSKVAAVSQSGTYRVAFDSNGNVKLFKL